MSDTPFDQPLYDAVMADMLPAVSATPLLKDVYENAAIKAARIAAERQTVSDDEGQARQSAYSFGEELASILSTIDFEHESDLDMMVADILDASVRLTAAIGPQVPVIPEWVEGYEVVLPKNPGDEYGVALRAGFYGKHFMSYSDEDGYHEYRVQQEGSGPTLQSAIDACTAAREGEPG
jgi:hypothetical protein